MHCTYCGAEIKNEKAKFCTKCGKAVPARAAKPVQYTAASTENATRTATVVAEPKVKPAVEPLVEPKAQVIEQGTPCKVWPEWILVDKPLGRGSYGSVYKAVRTDHNVKSFAAIKIITIPTDPGELDSLRSEGLTVDATKTYLQQVVNDFVSEIQLMESMKGVQNIVSVEDYKVVERDGEIGWDIYIRMELLTPFGAYIANKTMTEDEVIKIGCDICSALELCGRRSVIHRDIKPENIFINDFGHFKLGDFGIARKMENVTGGLSQKGTFNYMAPEVANSKNYDARVDIYSLGLVLYRLLNGNRLPFLNTEQQLMNPNERRIAAERRIKGEALPAPSHASKEMADVILRACAYDPAKRFASATEMKDAMLRVKYGSYVIAPDMDVDKTVSVRKPPVPGQTAAKPAQKSVANQVDYDKTTAVRKPPAAAQQTAQRPNPVDFNKTTAVRRPPADASVDYNKTTAVRRPPAAPAPKSQQNVKSFSPKKKKSKIPLVVLLLLLLLVLLGAGYHHGEELIEEIGYIVDDVLG